MIAAACLAQQRNEESIEALESTMKTTPQSIDTGDGLIYPGSCFSVAIATIKDHSQSIEQFKGSCLH